MTTATTPGELSLRSRLYRGETRLDIVGKRRIWYLVSAIVLAAGILSLGVRGFNLSIDFKGGDAFQFAANGHSLSQAESVLTAQGISDPVVQKLGEDQIRVTTRALPDGANSKVSQVQTALAQEFGLQQTAVSVQSVGSSWGSQITKKAVEGLLIFLVAVVFYIAVRFEAKMALAAIIALIHDLVITAGVYSLVGFQVSPSTVIALLTILGFSLYDTVVVFDRIRETTADIGPRSNRTYTDSANQAVNQTLMRSINTSLIALLPVAALLFVGAGLLGAGTLKDLALAQFVGLASGAYSSIFIATPLLAQFKEREPAMRELQKRVAFLATHKPGALDPAVGAGAGVGAVRRGTAGRPGVGTSAGASSGPRPAGEGSVTTASPGVTPAVPVAAPEPAADAAEGIDAAPPRVPGSPLRQHDPRRKRSRGRPSGKRR